MPVYEYHCTKCQKTFEVMRKFSDPPLTEHEDCGGALERLLSAPAFQLKGTGWYVTDYAKSGAKPAPSSQSDSGKGEGAESKSSSDSKTSDSKGDDSKASESKSSEKKGESKSESKPAPSSGKND